MFIIVDFIILMREIKLQSHFLYKAKSTNFTDHMLYYLQNPKFELYDSKTPFFTSPRFLPPTKVVKSKVWKKA